LDPVTTKVMTNRADGQAHYDWLGCADDEREHDNLHDEPPGPGPAATKREQGLDNGAGLLDERGPDDMMSTKVGGALDPKEQSTRADPRWKRVGRRWGRWIRQ
jgi:hypothetical protein